MKRTASRRTVRPGLAFRHAPSRALEKVGMVRCQPHIQPALEIVHNRQQFREVVVRYGVVSLVGGEIPFATERVDLHEQIRFDSQRQRQRLQRNRVVAGLIRGGSVTGGSQGNGRDTKQRIVGSSQSTFATQPCDARVPQASIEPAQEPLNLVSLGLVAMQLPDLDQVVQAHAHLQ